MSLALTDFCPTAGDGSQARPLARTNRPRTAASGRMRRKGADIGGLMRRALFSGGESRGMANPNEPGGASDRCDLDRFVEAQDDDYEQALSEIRSGRKRSHWMWYVFPQLDGLGFSSTSKRYAIKSKAEAAAYLSHPVLGPRLRECAEAVLQVQGRSALEIFGSPDDMKLRSCATLFARVSPAGSVFHRLLDNYFQGEPDAKTLRLLDVAPEVK